MISLIGSSSFLCVLFLYRPCSYFLGLRVMPRRVVRYTGANKPKMSKALMDQLSQKEPGLALTKKGRIPKKRVFYDGQWFDSPQERNRYQDLRLLEASGQIADLKVQVRIPLILGGVPIKKYSDRYKNGRQVKYVADFVYFDVEKGYEVVEDSKGVVTDVYAMKRAIMRAMGYHILETR